MKNSVQRDIIRSNILHRYDHPTAELICLSARKTNPKISLATVYRHLDKLIQENLISRISIPGEPDRFDPIWREHIHARCNKCDKLYDINIQLLDKLSNKVKSETGVEVNDIQLIVSGICKKCKIN